MRPSRPLARAVVMVLTLLVACRESAPPPPVTAGEIGVLSVTGAYAMVAPPGPGGSAYFTLINHGAAPDTVVGVTVGGAVGEMHEVRRDGDLARMVPILPWTLLPGDSLALRPGGIHVMYSADQPIAAGDTLDLTLDFAVAGALRMRIPVRAFGVE